MYLNILFLLSLLFKAFPHILTGVLPEVDQEIRGDPKGTAIREVRTGSRKGKIATKGCPVKPAPAVSGA